MTMPRGDKSAYTDKQKRQAEHIEEGYEHRGVPEEEAERRAWATVNKETGGGKKSGSGRGKPRRPAKAKNPPASQLPPAQPPLGQSQPKRPPPPASARPLPAEPAPPSRTQ